MSFWQTLSDTIHRTVNLRVVTIVGDATFTGPLESLQITLPAQPQASLVTDINIAGGDITQIVSPGLTDAAKADLRTAHDASVKQAQDILERNINILISIAKELEGKLENLVPPSTGPNRN